MPWIRLVGLRYKPASRSAGRRRAVNATILKILGAALETFVLAKLTKLTTAAELNAAPTTATKTKNEVDLVTGKKPGDIVGIEVKAAVTVTTDDFAGPRKRSTACNPHVRCDLVLHNGDNVHSFGAAMYAIPLASLSAGNP